MVELSRATNYSSGRRWNQRDQETRVAYLRLKKLPYYEQQQRYRKWITGKRSFRAETLYFTV